MADSRKVIHKRWYDNHKPERRAQTREYNLRLRKAVFVLLGDKCKKCGFDDWRALQIDHINGGGVQDKKEKKGMYIKAVMDEILAGSEKYQLLCANCNWIKRYTNNETIMIK